MPDNFVQELQLWEGQRVESHANQKHTEAFLSPNI